MKFERWVVVKTVIILYTFLVLLNARSIYEWSIRLNHSPSSQWLRQLALQVWHDTSKISLDYPARYLEYQLTKRDLSYEAIRQASSDYRQSLVKRDQAIGASLPELNVTPEGNGEAKALLIGDSNMMRLGPELSEVLRRDRNINATIKAKLATGLARKDVHNWALSAESLLRSGSYKYAIFMLGANDGQDIEELGLVASYGSSEWPEIYRKRVDELLSITCQSVAKALWIALPPMRDPSLDNKVKMINRVASKAIRESSCGVFIHSGSTLANADLRYTDYKMIAGRLEKIRADDGIHITNAGNRLLADEVLDKIDGHSITHRINLTNKIGAIRKSSRSSTLNKSGQRPIRQQVR
jgi:hypothetical protein